MGTRASDRGWRASRRRTIPNMVSPAAFSILVVLADGEQHGYAIMQEIDRLTGGHEPVGPTTLYRTIRQLLDLGFIEELNSRSDQSDQRRRYYRLTAAGRKAAVAETQRLDKLVRIAHTKRALRARTA